MVVAEFENWKMRIFLGCAATTSSAMGKWRLRLDSARQVGLETALEGVLIVVVGCCTTSESQRLFWVVWIFFS